MSWKNLFQEESQKEYYKNIISFLQEDKKSYTIYPPREYLFNAFGLCSLDKVKVVILGQDPYHGPNQAHGLSFSVLPGVHTPPSLVNIFKEIKNDLGIVPPNHGNLTAWAQQGVLLLNASLTVRDGQPNSHKDIGWHIFTDKVISVVNSLDHPVVFLLWGSFARKKKILIDNQNHLILEAAHPSPLSAHSGFFGCKHFSQVNEFLRKNSLEEINWNLND